MNRHNVDRAAVFMAASMAGMVLFLSCAAGCGSTTSSPIVDTDGDGIADSADGCPSDPAKGEPGLCGCGIADTDTDADGNPDCSDECPTDPAKTEAGQCGCGEPEIAGCSSDGDQPQVHSDLAGFKDNPSEEMLQSLIAGQEAPLVAPTDPSVSTDDCKASWEVDGDGSFSDSAKVATMYMPGLNDTLITVLVTCAQSSEKFQQTVAVSSAQE